MADSESKIRKILTEDVKWFITLGSVVVSVTLGYSSLSTQIAVLQNDVDTIKGNHLIHIEQAIKDNSDATKENAKAIVDLIKSMKIL